MGVCPWPLVRPSWRAQQVSRVRTLEVRKPRSGPTRQAKTQTKTKTKMEMQRKMEMEIELKMEMACVLEAWGGRALAVSSENDLYLLLNLQ